MHLIRIFVLSISLALMAPFAFADAKSEAFVRDNAELVLATLEDESLTPDERAQQFETYMDTFSNQKAISNFVIGKYARRFTPDELAAYRAAFRAYSLVVYRTQFDAFRGGSLSVVDSLDRNERDSVVNTIVYDADGAETQVRWRVLFRNNVHQIVDVALNIDGNLLWLAIEQRAQFLDLLDRADGSASALVKKLEELTEEARAGTS